MSAYRWDFATVLQNWQILARGLAGTFQLAVVSLGAGLALGLLVGGARYSRNRLLYWPATAYVEIFRNTPVLVQIMWFFFAFPIVAPFEVSGYAAATLALSLNTSAFSAEIFRAGIQSIARGQWDAARALGMTYSQQMRRVILPQAVRRMLPAFTNRGLELLKMTSLASAIAFPELLYAARTIATAHFNPIEAYTTVALVYFAIAWPLTQLVYAVERALRRQE
jgi:polar amino acid transport system permease protein